MIRMLEIRHGVVSVFDKFLFGSPIVFRNAHQQLRPRNDSLSFVLFWEIGSSPKGATVARAKKMERPTSRLVEHSYGFEIGQIDVRPFFAVDLYANEMPVHDGSYEFVLE